MRVLWENGPTAAEDVIRKVRSAHDWTDGTIRTLIARLLQKKVIKSRKEGSRAIYVPLVVEADYLQSESQNFLDRLFGGQVAPMVAHLAEHGELSASDIQRIKAEIRKLEKKDGAKKDE